MQSTSGTVFHNTIFGKVSESEDRFLFNEIILVQKSLQYKLLFKLSRLPIFVVLLCTVLRTTVKFVPLFLIVHVNLMFDQSVSLCLSSHFVEHQEGHKSLVVLSKITDHLHSYSNAYFIVASCKNNNK